MRPVTEYLTSRAQRGRDMIDRATPGPVLARMALWFWGVVALAIACPASFVFSVRGALVIASLGLLPTLFPRTRMVSAVLFAAVFGWLVDTILFSSPTTTWRLVGLSGALYLVHSGAALAAVLPYDTVVAPGVLVGWFLRALGVVAVTAVFGVLAVAGSGLFGGLFGGRSFLVASVAGVAVVCLLGWLFARAVRR